MSRYALYSLAFAASVPYVLAQIDPAVTQPLSDKRYDYPAGIPYMVDTDQGTRRGPQQGFNICNSTTQNQNSLCQTSMVNGIDDFCLWAPAKPNSTIADTEGEEVAWCTKPGHGTRLIPDGALQGVQYLTMPDYVQIVGFIDQKYINIQDGDFGGELDPHGADLRGNPVGGLLYSNAFGTDKNAFQQVIEWTNFMGGGAFCLKICNPAGPHAADFCQHIFDRIGCAYNAPNNAKNGTFEVCKADNAAFPGVYTVNGQAMTYTQPPESLGAISTMPYTATPPASSSCTTFESKSLYTGLPTPSTSSSSAKPTSSGSSSSSGGKSGSSSSHAGGSSPTGKPSGNGAAGPSLSGFPVITALLGVAFGVLLLQ